MVRPNRLAPGRGSIRRLELFGQVVLLLHPPQLGRDLLA
jgi:hypothetical protein